MKTLREKLATAEIIKIKKITAIKSGSELIMSFENAEAIESFLNEDPTALFEKLNVKTLAPCTKGHFALCLDAMKPTLFEKLVTRNKHVIKLLSNEKIRAAIEKVNEVEKKLIESKVYTYVKKIVDQKKYLSLIPERFLLETSPVK
jgi:hypothetical protein